MDRVDAMLSWNVSKPKQDITERLACTETIEIPRHTPVGTKQMADKALAHQHLG